MLAIIGGTGIYQIEGIQIIESKDIQTPFGKPSAKINIAQFKDKQFLFIPRHGNSHEYLPHEINYRANIFALKQLGARQILSFSAVGSLRKEIKPGEFAIANQYFDFIKGNREKTFFGGGLVAHTSTAKPVCENLANWVVVTSKKNNFSIHTNKTYGAVDGPRLGTKAESHFLRQIGCDLVGMTNVPEVFLAREAQICYASVGIVTDYDCWLDDPNQIVSVQKVIETYGKSIEKAKNLLFHLLANSLPEINEQYRKSLTSAVLTPKENLSENNKKILEVLET